MCAGDTITFITILGFVFGYFVLCSISAFSPFQFNLNGDLNLVHSQNNNKKQSNAICHNVEM